MQGVRVRGPGFRRLPRRVRMLRLLGPPAQDEPSVLPARVPHLLVNGAAGIAVGIATKIPPHNLREVVDALCALIDAPGIDLPQLMRHIPGPDFPTGACTAPAPSNPSPPDQTFAPNLLPLRVPELDAPGRMR